MPTWVRITISVLLLSSPARAQAIFRAQNSIQGQVYTKVQATTQQACTTPCAITVTSTGSGNLLVIDGTTSTASKYITNATSGACTGSWVFPAASQATSVGNGISSSYAYCLNSVSGQTSITVTMGANGTVRIWEYSSVLAPAFDQCGTFVSSSASTSQSGVGFTLATSSETILQVVITPQSITAISSPYGNLITGGRGSADNENTSSGATPTWTLSAAGNVVASACAFK